MMTHIEEGGLYKLKGNTWEGSLHDGPYKEGRSVFWPIQRRAVG